MGVSRGSQRADVRGKPRNSFATHIRATVGTRETQKPHLDLYGGCEIGIPLGSVSATRSVLEGV